MKAENTRRVLAYSAAGLVLGGLAWGGWFRTVDADPDTLLSCAAMEMTVARTAPASPEGRKLREQSLARAESFLHRAVAAANEDPKYHVVEGDLHALRGKPESALASYGSALSVDDCVPNEASMLLLRRAELLLGLDRPSEALEEARKAQSLGVSRFETKCELMAARAHLAQGRRDDALEWAARPASRGDNAGSIEAAAWLESVGEFDAAAQNYRAGLASTHHADYCLARLKVRQSDFDTALDLLNRAISHDRPGVLRLVRQDKETWRACAEIEGFRELLSPKEAAPR